MSLVLFLARAQTVYMATDADPSLRALLGAVARRVAQEGEFRARRRYAKDVRRNVALLGLGGVALMSLLALDITRAPLVSTYDNVACSVVSLLVLFGGAASLAVILARRDKKARARLDQDLEACRNLVEHPAIAKQQQQQQETV